LATTSHPRSFKFRSSDSRPSTYIEDLPQIDRKRATAVLVRQSRTGADTAQAESRETQLGLQDYGRLLYADDEPDVRLYDEGAGVSGQKRIDQRSELDRLFQDMYKGVIGTIVLAREDRLFRNKHMDQVGAFTKLAEEKRIKVVVPPISLAATDERTRVYDFTIYRDLCDFQDKMREAYGYIEGHVKYMLHCKQNKADKGGYDGRLLPPGLAVKGKKQNQTIVIYEPWAKVMRKLALRAQALDWRMGQLNREIEQMAYLFPEIPDEDSEVYLIKTCIHHIPGVGYKPRSDQTVRDWFTNEMLIGWWQPDEDKPDVIIDNHPAVLDYNLFAKGYAHIKGYTLEGELVENYRGVPRVQSRRKTPPGLLFHGKLLLTSPSPHETTFICAYEQMYEGESTLNYLGYRRASGHILRKRWCCIPGVEFDAIVIERLLALEKADKELKDRVRTALEQVYNQQSEDFISIPLQLEGMQAQLVENAKKRLRTSTDDPLYAMLEMEKIDLVQRQSELEAKKNKLGMVDSPEEIAQLHTLLGNFEAVWPSFDLFQRQRAFSLLINRIEVEVVSPHWLRLSIDWLDAVCPRIDIAYIWKASPGRSGKFSDEEKELIRQHYPRMPYMELLQLLPSRTWHAIQGQTARLGLKREIPADPGICTGVCYKDMVPKLDGQFLFGDYDTTLGYITKAISSTAKSTAPLHAIWILSESVEGLIALVERDLHRQACLSHAS
jgi:Resolvase, N terminal domain